MVFLDGVGLMILRLFGVVVGCEGGVFIGVVLVCVVCCCLKFCIMCLVKFL